MSARTPPAPQNDAGDVTEQSGRKRFLPLVFAPTLLVQCWGFMIGSALFAVSTAPGFHALAGASVANLLCFIGAWFFTGAGLVQLARSTPVTGRLPGLGRRVLRAEWMAAITQSLGTVAFNVSTAAALFTLSLSAEERFVWSPDAGGSAGFLVSGVLLVIAYSRKRGRFFDLGNAEWWSAQINLLGCVAFGFSAFGAFVLPDGQDLDALMASGGTFIGAICFFVASLVMLPSASRLATADANYQALRS